MIWCGGTAAGQCPRYTLYVPAEELLERFGDVTCEQAQRRVVCTACGARGRDGKIQVLPSTMDMSDTRNGYPAGRSERMAIECMAERENRDRDWYARNGWTWRDS